MHLIRFQRLKAFTLSEILVVLVVTIVVVGLAFSVLDLVQKQMWGIQKNYKEESIDNSLQQALWIDFHLYSKIEYSSINSILELKHEMGSTKYEFHKDYVVKDRDTFYSEFKVHKVYFQGNEIEEGIIDAVKLTKTGDEINKKLFVFRNNDAAVFIN
ncbi:hypothetical protein GTQ34_16555 [Muricauda sp. JGD-17]|uniref:Prepilin-type N-terminal cleavage/methylation domain-containing protein n=1 Tax=Flagellimonas ochracea TaxID=2696472 RepID=A0A964WYS7_9FLAO|nr:hypothetical protein [Allomuricauda ochracea]NAY93520.1 hypothetical protein [Allomuricauda ochracea]